MAISGDWQRLAALVSERRGDLGLTQEEVRAAGGPSTATQRLIEGGHQSRYQPRILAALETGLKWQRGSVRRILAGGDPLPLPGEPATAPLAAAPEPSRETPGDDVTGAIVAALFGPQERRIWAQVRRRLEATPAGAALFADPRQAALWPAEAPDGFSGGAPFELTAEVRRLLDATPPDALFDATAERVVWGLDKLQYRKRVEMIREYREPVRGAGTARRAGLKKPDGLTA